MDHSRTESLRSARTGLAVLGVIAVCGAAQLIAGLVGVYTWIYVLAPLFIIVLVTSLIWAKAAIPLLLVSLFIRIELPGFVGVYPSDILTLAIIFGVFGRAVLFGTPNPLESPLTAPMIIVLAVFAISTIGAFDLRMGVVNWFRHLQMFALIAAVAATVDARGVRRILFLLLCLAVGFSLPNILASLQLGGRQRVFGLAGPFFPFYAGVGIIYCSIGFLLSHRLINRGIWALIALILGSAVMATMTREAMLLVLLGILFACVLVWIWAKGNDASRLRRRIIWLVAGCSLVSLVLLSDSIPVFRASSTRIHQAIEGNSNTIRIRLFLWRVGFQTFRDSPILGIGLAQITHLDDMIPAWHFDPMAQFSRGLGAHNDLVTYAAETGLVGLLALTLFFGVIVRYGWHEWRHAENVEALQSLLAIWVPCLALIARFCFGTHTFYSSGGLFDCLLFGMFIAHVKTAQRDRISLSAS